MNGIFRSVREYVVIFVPCHEFVEILAQLVDIGSDPIIRTVYLMRIHPDQLHVVHELM